MGAQQKEPPPLAQEKRNALIGRIQTIEAQYTELQSKNKTLQKELEDEKKRNGGSGDNTTSSSAIVATSAADSEKEKKLREKYEEQLRINAQQRALIGQPRQEDRERIRFLESEVEAHSRNLSNIVQQHNTVQTHCNMRIIAAEADLSRARTQVGEIRKMAEKLVKKCDCFLESGAGTTSSCGSAFHQHTTTRGGATFTTVNGGKKRMQPPQKQYTTAFAKNNNTAARRKQQQQQQTTTRRKHVLHEETSTSTSDDDDDKNSSTSSGDFLKF